MPEGEYEVGTSLVCCSSYRPILSQIKFLEITELVRNQTYIGCSQT